VDKLIAAFALPNLLTIFATVATLMASGFFVGRWINLYPIEAAIVNACHSGQGGTGDVAILTAANRMQLMPFAQIATRIGGAIHRHHDADRPADAGLGLGLPHGPAAGRQVARRISNTCGENHAPARRRAAPRRVAA